MFECAQTFFFHGVKLNVFDNNALGTKYIKDSNPVSRLEDLTAHIAVSYSEQPESLRVTY